jgi:DegV family protein with EDD domain
MTVRVICDSSQNVPEAYLARLGIVEVQASLVFGDEVYLNKVDMSEAEFYQRLINLPKGAPLPTTAQPSPGQFTQAVQQAKAEGATSVILTAVTAKLSGTYNSALQAAQMETEIPVTVWDTTSVSLGAGWQTIRAAELVQAGAAHHEILAALPHIRDHITTIFTVDTLKYLAASGRLSSAQAMMGALLNIKPMLMVDEGVLKPVGRERGRRSAKAALIDLALTRVGDAAVRVAIAHTNVLDEAQAFEPQVRAALNVQELLIVELGPVLAALAGPGVMALGVMQVTP